MRDQILIIGLTSLFIASKYEDKEPITLNKILKDAGHGKYAKEEILALERDILKTLTYNLHLSTIYQESQIISKNLLITFKKYTFAKQEKEIIQNVITFFAMLSTYDLKIQ